MPAVGVFGPEVVLNGNATTPVPLVSTPITVKNTDGTAATLYTNSTGTTAAGSNVVNTDNRGQLTFYAVPNFYDLTYSDSLGSQTLRVQVGESAGHVAATTAQVLNVMNYGAVGNGSTDDSAAIQKAINAQQTGALGSVVYLPPGTYLCNSMLVMAGGLSAPYSNSTRPLVIRGAGMDQSTIKMGGVFGFGGLIAPSGSGSHPLVAQVVMSDITLDGNYSGAGGSIAQPASAAGALVNLPWPGTADTAPSYNGRYHLFERVKFYRPTGYCFQPTTGVKLTNCEFDTCGQPPETNHYDNLGSGPGDAIVINCTWRNSKGNYADFVGTATGFARLVMIGCQSFNHDQGGIYACGDRSIIALNRLKNNSAGSGIGYDAWTDLSNVRNNMVVCNILENIAVVGTLDDNYGDLVAGNMTTTGAGGLFDFMQAINAIEGVRLPAATEAPPGAGIWGDGTNVYLAAEDNGSLIIRPDGIVDNAGSVWISKADGIRIFDSTATSRSAIRSGTGVPSNSVGTNGDFYLRQDGGAGTAIYQKRAGAWVAVV